MSKKPFKGVIKLDIRDSKPDWGPFTLAKGPEGAPNVLVVLYDDTGLAAWSPFGGGINMPTVTSGRRQYARFLPTATACSTWQATSGSGPRTGIRSMEKFSTPAAPCKTRAAVRRRTATTHAHPTCVSRGA